MKLKTSVRSVAGIRISDKPAININKKSGMFRFNNCINELMDNKPGDKVKFYQDEDKPEDWYIGKVPVTDELGLVIRNGSSTTSSLIVASTVAARTLFRSISFMGNSLVCQVAFKPTEGMWAIITKSAINRDRK